MDAASPRLRQDADPDRPDRLDDASAAVSTAARPASGATRGGGGSPERSPSVVIGGLTDRHVHFIGIGGCGMSGLARLLARLGATCTGSDAARNHLIDELIAEGIEVRVGDEAGALPGSAEVVVHSAAVGIEHPEVQAARSADLRIMRYAEALGIVQGARTGISIAGTHGKSTTGAMLAHVLAEAGLDPSVVIGAVCRQIGGGSRMGAELVPATGGGDPLAGRPGLLIVEACEFQRSFLHHRPAIGLITSVEADHLDVYGSLENVVAAFREFAWRLPERKRGGLLLIAHDVEHRASIVGGLTCCVMTYGTAPGADARVEVEADGTVVLRAPRGRLLEAVRGGAPDSGGGKRSAGAGDESTVRWTPQLPGEHMVLNAAAAATLGLACGADPRAIEAALSGFRGVERRLERLGERPAARGGSVVVYDDYGHHPTELRATLRSIRGAESPKRLLCVFQPHQHSRTRLLLDDFATAFADADLVVVPEIYHVRDPEIERQRIDARDLVDRIRAEGVEAMHVHPFEAVVGFLRATAEDGDVVAVVGAGPVGAIARRYMDDP